MFLRFVVIDGHIASTLDDEIVAFFIGMIRLGNVLLAERFPQGLHDGSHPCIFIDSGAFVTRMGQLGGLDPINHEMPELTRAPTPPAPR